jgi:hypothetical protein
MTPITASTIFPLKYPKGDPSIPLQGALAVPVEIDFSQDTQFEIYLQQLREQNNFGSLRCIWIDNNANSESIVVAINGTDQILNVPANSQNYYAVIILNLPTVTLTVASLAETATPVRLIFLNFVPFIPTPPQLTFSGTLEISGSVEVTNFPNPQNVNVENFPATQSISGAVSITNFPASQSITGNVGVTSLPSIPAGTNNIGSVNVANFPANQSISGSVSISNFPSSFGATQSTTPWVDNISQWGGASTSLGQKVSASSVPVVIASDQSEVNVVNAPIQYTGTAAMSSTTPQVFSATAGFTKLRSVFIDLAGLQSTATISVTIKDGAGNTLQVIDVMTFSSATNFPNYRCLTDMNSVMNNTSAGASITLSAATSAGSIFVSLGYSN